MSGIDVVMAVILAALIAGLIAGIVNDVKKTFFDEEGRDE